MEINPNEYVAGSNIGAIKYHHYHKNRLKFAWDIIEKVDPSSTLEVGPWTLTYWLRKNGRLVDTVGSAQPEMTPGFKEIHYETNLRNLNHRLGWFTKRCDKRYELVIACEVIEHLPVDMTTVFEYLKSAMKPGGYLLIQTPNAVALKKRFAMIAGRNPFDLIREENAEFNHIREFTLDELVTIGKAAGLRAVFTSRKNYFAYDHSWKAKLYKAFDLLFPGSCKDGITILFRNPITNN